MCVLASRGGSWPPMNRLFLTTWQEEAGRESESGGFRAVSDSDAAAIRI